jgi:hypothetical protein
MFTTYTNSEWADIHFTYGKANGNARKAQRLYRNTYPQRRCPSKDTFSASHRYLRETGTFRSKTAVVGSNRITRTDALENSVLGLIEENPQCSTRQIARDMNTSQSSIWRILHEYNFYPYHVQRVQALSPADFPYRVEYCTWFLQKCLNPNFISTVLFTDEAMFARSGILNYHNNHNWDLENPHAIVQTGYQQKFSWNVWGGIIGDLLIGPFFLPPTLNGNYYRYFLEFKLPGLLEDVTLDVRRIMFFMHDGAPAHFSLVAREHLNNIFPNRWIGRSGPVRWPARSPDLNPLDFFLWGHLKSIVYSTPVQDVQDLKQRIINGFEKIRLSPGIFERVRNSIKRRYDVCVQAEGGHFEQLL